MAAHYANSFTFEPHRCFRMITQTGVGHPAHCHGQVIAQGRWRTGADQLVRVDACAEHADQLVAPIEWW
jgi:hypothetical protein